jgi:hypothetical protein
MSRLISTRWIVLGGTLLATVAAAVIPHTQDGARVQALEPRAPAVETAAQPGVAEAPAEDVLPERKPAGHAAQDLFASASWVAAGKPAPAVRVAPPFSYAVVGSVVDDGALTAVLTKDDRNYLLRVGEVLDQTYRVDKITSRAITVTYLPLGIKQHLPMGGLQ